MRHKMIKLNFGAIALCCITFFIMVMTPADAKDGGFHKRGLCSRVGTWHGVGDQGFTWMAIETPGQNAINGQITVEWIELDPTLGGFFPDAVRATNAIGVWKKVGWRMYEYTWIAYGLDQEGMQVYTARASGTAYLVDCDHAEVDYVLELWRAGFEDIYTDPPYFCAPGIADEYRMPLVQASCP